MLLKKPPLFFHGCIYDHSIHLRVEDGAKAIRKWRKEVKKEKKLKAAIRGAGIVLGMQVASILAHPQQFLQPHQQK